MLSFLLSIHHIVLYLAAYGDVPELLLELSVTLNAHYSISNYSQWNEKTLLRGGWERESFKGIKEFVKRWKLI